MKKRYLVVIKYSTMVEFTKNGFQPFEVLPDVNNENHVVYRYERGDEFDRLAEKLGVLRIKK